MEIFNAETQLKLFGIISINPTSIASSLGIIYGLAMIMQLTMHLINK
jgi:hypothetical protein